MTLQPPMMVRGADHSARAMRLMIRDLARGRQGIAESEDLKVQPLPTPGPGVRVGDGSALIHGARPWQGTYTQSNIGDAEVTVSPTGPLARTDLIVLRIEDPEWEGERDPRTQEIGYFHVVEAVAGDASAVPDGMTGIALARITLPRNTAAITADMITDLRQIANPRTERLLRTVHPTATETVPAKHGQWAAWPKEAAWDLDIPTWATRATIVVTLSGLRAEAGPVYAELRTRLGSGPPRQRWWTTTARPPAAPASSWPTTSPYPLPTGAAASTWPSRSTRTTSTATGSWPSPRARRSRSTSRSRKGPRDDGRLPLHRRTGRDR